MSSNNCHDHGCSGCSGCGGSHHGSSACNSGPFTAVDPACLNPQVRSKTGALIAFASGTPVALTNVAGAVSTPAMVGFGTNFPLPTIFGNTVNLTPLLNEAFSVARPGTLTAISASFTVAAGLALSTSSVTIRAQIWRAPAGTNNFSPTSAFVDLAPALTGLTLLQTIYGQSDSFAPVQLAFGDRLVMVFSQSTVGIPLVVAFAGTASAGINIE